MTSPRVELAAPTRVLRYEARQMREHLLEDLDEFMTWTQGDRRRAVLGDETAAWLRAQDRRVRDRLSAPFRLVVIGDFKRGKSSLVNALLGQHVVPANVTPETLTINEIGFGEQIAVGACLTDGATVELQPGDLCAERLAPILRDLPAQVDHLIITATVPWLRDVLIVDTPGTADGNARWEERVAAYLLEADAVIHVSSALAPLSESEQAFLRNAVLPHDFSKILFVVNMLDLADVEHDVGRVLDATSAKLTSLFPDAPLFGVSAMDENCRIHGTTRPNPELERMLAAQFAEFRDRLAETVILNHDVIQLDRAAVRVSRVGAELGARVQRLRSSLNQEQVALDDSLAACDARSAQLTERLDQSIVTLRKTVDDLGEQATGWLTEFVERLHRDSLMAIEVLDPDAVQRHFQFYLADVMRQAVGRCLDAHRPTILAGAAAIEHEWAAGIVELDSLDAEASTAGSAVARAAFGDFPSQTTNVVGSLIAALAPGPLGSLIEIGLRSMLREGQGRRGNRARLTWQLPDVRSALHSEVRRIYAHVADRVADGLRAAAAHDIDMVIAAMRQAQALHEAGEQNAASVRTILDEVEARSRSMASDRARFREKLWTRTVLAPTTSAPTDLQSRDHEDARGPIVGSTRGDVDVA